MNSKIEQLIGEIEEYIENCKPQLLNASNIVVEKEVINGLLMELRHKTPEEIRRVQKIYSQRDAILADAHTKAEEILKQAEKLKAEQVSEHEVMQQAYEKANEIVSAAKQQAQEIYSHAVQDADEIRMGAISYTDDLLSNMQDVLSRSIETTQARTAHLLESLQEYLNVVTANRSELAPPEGAQEEATADVGGQMELDIPYSTDSQAPGQ